MPQSGQFGDGSISADVLGSRLTISTTHRLAGAIGSMTWRNKEFINQDDHGRELQSASSFDNLGECFNPTEAGSSRDGVGPTSTSKLIGYHAEGNQLKTTTQMAFWLAANEDYRSHNNGKGCGGRSNLQIAQNTTDLSNHLLSKQVTIGFSGLSNVIEYLVTFKVTEPHQSATFEALTGYLGKDFSSFFSYNPSADQFNQLSAIAGEQNLPVILSTPDSIYAMGIYSPDLPQPEFPSMGYGRFNFYHENTMKWNAVYRRLNTPAGDYSFRQFVIVGSLAEVQDSMRKLHKLFHVSAPTPTPTPPAQSPTTQDNHRFNNPATGAHFITSSYNEGISANYKYEGVAFKSFDVSSVAPNLMIIYRCYQRTSARHFVSSNPSCEGFTQEGSLGKIYSTQVLGSSALHRFYNPSTFDYLITVSYLEGSVAFGYVYEGIIGYVP